MRFFATGGVRPYWLADHWAGFLAALGLLVVALNTLVLTHVDSDTARMWINAAVAMINTVILWLHQEVGGVRRVAAWRARVRKEDK